MKDSLFLNRDRDRTVNDVRHRKLSLINSTLKEDSMEKCIVYDEESFKKLLSDLASAGVGPITFEYIYPNDYPSTVMWEPIAQKNPGKNQPDEL